MFAKAVRFSLVAAILCLPVAAIAAARIHARATIHADRGWQKVEIELRGRGILRFESHGQWNFNPSLPAVSGSGASQLPTAGRESYTFSGPGGREGQLIGRIGRAPPFVVGEAGFHQVRRNEVGPLYLMINDDIGRNAGRGLTDNSGRLEVIVEYAP